MQTKQKVLHFIESAGVYGAERVILNLSAQMQNTGNYIPVVGCIVDSVNTESALYNAAVELGIAAIKIPIANTGLLRDLPKAAAQLKQARIDLIHSHGYKPSVFGFIIRLLKNIPVIATCHLWFEPSKGPLKTRTMIRLEKFFYRWFPKIIAVSDPIKAILLASNLKPQQVDVIRLMDRNKDKAQFFSERVTRYLITNELLYPLYTDAGNDYDTVQPVINNYNCGWNLDDINKDYGLPIDYGRLNNL